MRQIIAAALAAAALACSTPAADQSPQPKAAQPAAGASQPAANLPDGWRVRPDDASGAANGDSIRADAEKESLTFSSGAAAIYYKPEMKAEKDYSLTATFSQLKPATPPQPYGLFVGGGDLDKPTAHYTALLVRGDGRYQIVAWNGAAPKVIVDWTPAPEMREPKGVKTSNSLTIRALQGAVHFLIADKEVHQMPRAAAGSDGVAGVRIGAGLNVQVDKLSVKKFP